MKRLLFICLLTSGLVGASHATLIGFDDLASGTVVTNQYAEAKFSSSGANSNFVQPWATAASGGNIICTPACLEDTYVDFTNPVNNLTFWAIEPNFNGHDADFRVFENGVFSATVPLIGLGGAGNKFVDLSSFHNVTRLEIVNILNDGANENGIGWDSFSFDAVPEPGTYAVLGLGSLLLLRRRKK